MRESEESRVKHKLGMVEEVMSERFDEISMKRKDSISQKDLLKYVKPNFEKLNLRNIESLQEIILLVQVIDLSKIIWRRPDWKDRI